MTKKGKIVSNISSLIKTKILKVKTHLKWPVAESSISYDILFVSKSQAGQKLATGNMTSLPGYSSDYK